MQGSKALPQAEREGTSITSLVLVVGVLLAIAAFFVVTTAPLEPLLGESSYAAISAFHGLSAGVMLVVVTIGLYLGYELFVGQILNLRERKRDRPAGGLAGFVGHPALRAAQARPAAQALGDRLPRRYRRRHDAALAAGI